MSRNRLTLLILLSMLAACLTLAGCDKSSEGDGESGTTENEGEPEAEGEGAADEGEAEGGAETAAAPAETSDGGDACADFFEAVAGACKKSLREGAAFHCGHALVELKTLRGLAEGKLAAGQEGTCKLYLDKVNKAISSADTRPVTLERDCATMADALEQRCLDPLAEGTVKPRCEMPIKTWSAMAQHGTDLKDATCTTVLGMLPDE